MLEFPLPTVDAAAASEINEETFYISLSHCVLAYTSILQFISASSPSSSSSTKVRHLWHFYIVLQGEEAKCFSYYIHICITPFRK